MNTSARPRIIVLGSRGMLGQMVAAYFRDRAMVTIIDDRQDFSKDGVALDALRRAGPGIVVNCVGLIKQKSEDMSGLLLTNSVLPLQLYEALAPGQFLVQPSTDCVFSGQTTVDYHWRAPCDAADMYGWSKRLGELALDGKERACIVRVSIIGLDRVSKEPKGLLGWFLSQPPGTPLNGYTDHYWNGITTLEWCRLIEREIIADGGDKWGGRLMQVASPRCISKYELLLILQKYFKTDYDIAPAESSQPRRMCLAAMVMARDITEQIGDLSQFRGI